MKRFGRIAVAGVLLLTGCSLSPAQPNEPDPYDTAIQNCESMASNAMPNGMQDPDAPSAVLDSAEFCSRLAAGYTREKFAELYNDPEWLANELDIWSDEGIE